MTDECFTKTKRDPLGNVGKRPIGLNCAGSVAWLGAGAGAGFAWFLFHQPCEWHRPSGRKLVFFYLGHFGLSFALANPGSDDLGTDQDILVASVPATLSILAFLLNSDTRGSVVVAKAAQSTSMV